MASTRNSERLQYRYGICLNDSCPKGKSKEVQQISARKEFVCNECGKPLRECPPPRSWWQMHGNKVIATSVAAIIVFAGGAFFVLSDGSEENKNVNPVETTVSVDSANTDAPIERPVEDKVAAEAVNEKPVEVINEKPVEEVKVQTPVATTTTKANGKVQLSYGTYTGDMKNGYPHGQGRLTYTSDRQINRYDMKKRTAKAGQYVIGEFERGFFIQGRLYTADGELLESVMIGTAPGNTYESK